MSDFENLDYYDLLGVSRSASFDDIKRAYRREISKYHPDRFVNATPEEQAYASLRSQHLTEAYAVLSDLGTRSAYNRGQPTHLSARPPRGSAPPQQRDHQAELYDQAIQHMDAGRFLQAIGTLRQLQQINPFYRDSANLLDIAEAQLNHRADTTSPNRRWRITLISGAIAGLTVLAVAAWVLSTRFITVSRAVTPATAAVLVAAQPTAIPPPSALTGEPATAAPTTEPTAAPTEAPTAEPSAAPTAAPIEATAVPATALAPTAAPNTAAEGGALLVADTFNGSGWANLRGPGWQVGYEGRRYHIRSDAGNGPIWSYRTGPAADASIGVDIQMAEGEGGLLVRFLDAGNYVSVVINPSQTSYRIEQQGGGATRVLSGGQSEAIKLGADAVNRLVVRLQGNHVQVFANGQQLAEVDAPNAPDTERYGLVVFAKDSAADAYFDNLEIHALE